jgi:hypothetical protein
MAKMSRKAILPALNNPFKALRKIEFNIPGEISRASGGYEEAMQEGYDLIQRPIKSVSIDQIEKQHFKKRMTVWERVKVLTDREPNILFGLARDEYFKLNEILDNETPRGGTTRTPGGRFVPPMLPTRLVWNCSGCCSRSEKT